MNTGDITFPSGSGRPMRAAIATHDREFFGKHLAERAPDAR